MGLAVTLCRQNELAFKLNKFKAKLVHRKMEISTSSMKTWQTAADKGYII